MNKPDMTGKEKKMSRPRSKYYIPKERYYELKHFCLQFPIWEDAYNHLNECSLTNDSLVRNEINMKVEEVATAKVYYISLMEIVADAVLSATNDKVITSWLFEGVTRGKSFDQMELENGYSPCSRSEYYNTYKEFFYYLSLRRN